MRTSLHLILALCLEAGGGASPAAAPGQSAAGQEPADRPAGPVRVLDLRPLRKLDPRKPEEARRIWDTVHVAAALQGLANRDAPRLYVLYSSAFGVETDAFWFDWLRGEDGWLSEAEVLPVNGVEDAVAAFRDLIRGLVVYDESVPATSNAASTAAGCEDLLPVRYDPSPGSVYELLSGKLALPVRVRLVEPDGQPRFTGKGAIPDLGRPSTGSAKNDVHLWALERYLRSGKCAPGVAAYYLDAYWLRMPAQASSDLHTLSNHDWFIARRAFFFDLSAWGDERPNDDPGQPDGLDRRTLLEVLRALYERAAGGVVKIGGFTPWPFKYTDHPGVGGRHGGVETEWEFSRIVSQFNAYVEADAAGLSAMANASVFAHYPLRERYPQPAPRPTAETWKSRGLVGPDGRPAAKLFLGHYAGDYDSPAWLYKAVPAHFRDPARGKVPVGWAFNPNLSDRAGPAVAYAYRHATPADVFIAGDSGAGYVNPRALSRRPDSGLPPGLEAWSAHCERQYRRWDMTITGFLLDGSAGASTDLEFAAYRSFSPDGLGTHFEPEPAMRAGVPTCPEKDLPDDVGAAAQAILRAEAARRGRPGFFWARSILKSPSWFAALSERIRSEDPGAEVEVVDPYTFFGLIRLHLEGAPR